MMLHQIENDAYEAFATLYEEELNYTDLRPRSCRRLKGVKPVL